MTIIHEEAMQAMRAAVTPRFDAYPWCKEQCMYVPQEYVVEQLRDTSNSLSLVVVDTRDDDVAGGMITGAMHAADGEFEDIGLLALLARIRAMDANCVTVVLHCMESVRRGPRCALRLATYLRAVRERAPAHQGNPTGDPPGDPPGAVQEMDAITVELKVLEGGADQWIRRFFTDNSMVSNFDDDFWGFGLSDCDSEELVGTSREDATPHTRHHRLYERPHDQPETPWSAAGAGIAAEEIAVTAE